MDRRGWQVSVSGAVDIYCTPGTGRFELWRRGDLGYIKESSGETGADGLDGAKEVYRFRTGQLVAYWIG